MCPSKQMETVHFYFSTGALPPRRVTAVQTGPTSIRVTWTPPSPLGDTTGYRVSITGGGGTCDTVDVDGGRTNSHTLMGLTNGETYTISIVGTASPGLPSTPVEAGTVDLSKWKSVYYACIVLRSFNFTNLELFAKLFQ